MWDNIVAFIPIIVLMTGALLTKKIAEMMIIASFLGAVFVHKSNFFSGYIDMMYQTLSNESYQFVIIILMCFGAMIRLFQDSGAMAGFGKAVSKIADGPKKPLIMAWVMSCCMFIDDYLSTLVVPFSMKGLTDSNRIPREHLGMQVNIMSACLCVVIPFSCWTAFTVGLLGEHGVTYDQYVEGIPFMFYPIICIIMCMVLIFGGPKVGELRSAYARVRAGGPSYKEEKVDKSLVNIEMNDNGKEAAAINGILPIFVLVGVSIAFGNSLVHGLVATLVVQFVMYAAQKLMTVKELMDSFFEGAKSMCSMAIVICFAFMLSSANRELGFFEILIGALERWLSPTLLPVLTFITVAFATFATSGYWIMQVLSIPIFIPLAFTMGINPAIIIAAIMSGVTCGCNCCFYADPIFMTSAGTGLSNMKIVKTTAPYAIFAAVLTAIGYLIIGFI